jgi:molybdate transport system substrate-binding protein
MKYVLIAIVLLCHNSAAAAVPGTAADRVTYVAVASNFSAAAREITALFTQTTGHRVKLSFGSTGKLFTQVSHGAPFQVLLAADAERPQRLEIEGLAVAGTRFTYALGQLALYSTNPQLIDDSPAALSRANISRVAIANPQTAPYGAAAVEVMQALGVFGSLQPRLVRGENIAQTFQFVATGNAQLGFIALAQLNPDLRGSWWLVPADLHSPIRQQAVLLKNGADSVAAQSFLAFMQQPAATHIMRAYGYRLETP